MARQVGHEILYEPDENPPFFSGIFLGFQTIIGLLVTIVVYGTVMVRAAGQSDEYLSWAILMGIVVSGFVMILQAFRLWRIGAGYTLSNGPSSVFMVVCITALIEGGPALMSSLVIVATIFQVAMTTRLSLLRRVITPMISGTVLILLSATAITVLLGAISADEGITDASMRGVVVSVLATVGVVLGIRLFGTPFWQQWTPVITIGAGCVVSAIFGLYDFRSILEAPVVGAPVWSWPGLDVNFGVEFWALLPGFVVVFLASSINSIGEGMSVQGASWRRPRATDFRMIQGALNGIGVGNVVAGLLGVFPVALYPGNGSRTMMTGVAASRVGVYGGVILIVVAMLPKLVAVLIAIPAHVLAAYAVVVLGLLFVDGMRMVVGDGIDVRKATVVGLSFWTGMGFQYDLIFPQLLTGVWEKLLGNGMTTGSVMLVSLTLLLELSSGRRRRLEVELGDGSFSRIDEFLRDFASSIGWNEASTDKLRSAGEETLSSLSRYDMEEADGRRLVVDARLVEGVAELEFSAVSGDENIEDRLAYLNEQPEIEDEREISFRLLRYYASSVRHRKYHNVDIITVQVSGTR